MSWLCTFLVLALAVGSGARNLRQADAPEEGELWALLIAGSAGWGNYRHQADIAHAYQVLRRGGVKDNRIITMMYDDIADNPANPHPGQLFNRPGGEDVYAGVPVDYSHTEVTAANFLAVLAGDATRVTAGKHSSGRVVASGPKDKVFVYYSDHGAPGVLGTPSGPFLYADQLNAVIANKSHSGGFDEMVMYIEACESGSIFEGLLADNLSIYATTAANGHESSWGTYCPGMDPSPPPEFGTCLGDLYSVAWLENADHADLTLETLKKQFQLVKERVSQNFTYSQGSHVQRFGALDISEEVAAEFMGHLNTGDGTLDINAAAAASNRLGSASGSTSGGSAPWTRLGAVPQRDADLLHLYHKYATAAEGRQKAAALRELDAEVSRRAELDASVHTALSTLLEQTNMLGALQAKYGQASQISQQLQGQQGGRRLAAVDSGSGSDSADTRDDGAEGWVEVLLSGSLPRPAGAPVVDDWGCLRGMVAAWEGACGQLDQYGMRHTRAFANLCNAGVQPATLASVAQGSCPAASQEAGLVGPDAHVAIA